MYRSSIQSLKALIFAANLSLGMAAAPAVGIVTAQGSFRLDDSSIAGSATLFEGNRIETGTASSRLQLNNGARMQLSAESRGVVYQDRLVLERGTGRFERYAVEALSLRVQPDGGDTSAEVSVRAPNLAGSGLVQVSALNGPVRVIGANGVLLANLPAGRTLSFAPQEAEAASAITVTGCIERAGANFLLTDETSLVRFQVIGAGLVKEVGHRVLIAGSVAPVPESMSVIRSTTLRLLAKRCTPHVMGAAAAGTGSAGAGTAGTGAGGAPAASAGAAIGTKAVIAGVIIAGAATGAAVAVVKQEDAPAPISPSSR